MLRGYREAHGYKLEEAALILECDRSKIFPRRDRRARHPAQGAPRAAHRVRSSLARTIRWALSHGVRPELARLPITPEQVAEEYAKRSTARERT